MSSDRKPIVIAIILVVVAIVILVVGIALPANGRSPGQLMTLLKSFGAAPTLTAEDVVVTGPSCTFGAKSVTLTGECVITVTKFGGGLYLGPAVKSAHLTPVGYPLAMTLRVQGTVVEQQLDPGKRASLTFGTGGGSVHLTCLAPAAASCVITLT